MMMRYIQLLGLLLTCVFSFGITPNDYIEKINANYQALSSFQLTFDYKIYKGYSGNQIMENYQSTLHMNGLNSYRKLYQDEIITTIENTVVINHDMRTIQVMPPMETDIFDVDIKQSMKQCNDIKISKTSDGERIIITFKDFSSSPYARIEINIDDHFWVKHITVYYATQLNFSKDYFKPDLNQARLEIKYTNLIKNWDNNEGLTDLSKYLIKNGDKYEASPNYKSYEIIQ